MSVKVLVNGAGGRMGREVCRAVLADHELELYGVCDTNAEYAGQDIATLIGEEKTGITISVDLLGQLGRHPDVLVDFTHPESVKENIARGLASGVHCVVGTTGLSDRDFNDIEALAKESGANVLVAPNFAIGAVLLMEMSKIAAVYMDSCEIIELHHDKKVDAPSGTAIKTAEGLPGRDEARLKTGEIESLEGARGGVKNGVHIHSVRLPGLVAHQEVIFGGIGQTLSIRHDSIDRTSFMPGVVLAVKKVADYPGLTYGLDKILDI